MSHAITNPVKRRFFPLTESVKNGLEPEAKIHDFERIKDIKNGYLSSVFAVRHKVTKVTYAIKEFDMTKTDNIDEVPSITQGIEMLYNIKHPNIVKLYGHFEENNKFYYVMEYLKQDSLKKKLELQKSLEIPYVAKIIQDLINALFYLHNMDPPIIYRNIKLENLLFDDEGGIKLIDFASSNYLNGEARTTYIGAPHYQAPEQLKEAEHDEKVDVWCIGVLMFKLLTGNEPFEGKDTEDLKSNILNLKIKWPSDINTNARNLILKILKIDPKDRLSLEKILMHPFFSRNLSNPVTCLNKPSIVSKEPFVLRKDIPKESIVPSNGLNNDLMSFQEITQKLNQTDANSEYNNKDRICSKDRDNNPQTKSDITEDKYNSIIIKYDQLKDNYNVIYKEFNEIKLKNKELKQIERSMDSENKKLHKEINELLNNNSHLIKQLNAFKESKQKDEETIAQLGSDYNYLKENKEKNEENFRKEIQALKTRLSQKDTLNYDTNQNAFVAGISNERFETANAPMGNNFNNITDTNENLLAGLKKAYCEDEIERTREKTINNNEYFLLNAKSDENKKTTKDYSVIKEQESNQTMISKYNAKPKDCEKEIANK